MHDPFPIPPPLWLVRITRPLADTIGSQTLHLHIHEILLATLTYHLIYTVISPQISKRIFPSLYPKFNARTKLNWDVHVVALTQSVFVVLTSLWVIWKDDERRSMGWQERVWGYTGAGGMIQALAAGYFVWDLGLCINHLDVFGWGLLAHAVAALSVFSFGFRPFVNYYGPTFILYEISSPFLNLHWMFDKLNMTGSRPQWYNGMALLSSFFCCRLVWGTYQSVRVYQDVWAALHWTPLLSPSDPTARVGSAMAGTWSPDLVFEPLGESDEIMRFASPPTPTSPGTMVVPQWLAMVYLGSNIVLNTLNFYWFGKMIETVQSRFREPEEVRKRRWKGGVGEHATNPPAASASAGEGKGSTPAGRKEEEDEEISEGVMVQGLADSSKIIDSVMNVEMATPNGTVGGGVTKKKKPDGVSSSAMHVEEKATRRR